MDQSESELSWNNNSVSMRPLQSAGALTLLDPSIVLLSMVYREHTYGALVDLYIRLIFILKFCQHSSYYAHQTCRQSKGMPTLAPASPAPPPPLLPHSTHSRAYHRTQLTLTSHKPSSLHSSHPHKQPPPQHSPSKSQYHPSHSSQSGQYTTLGS